MSAVLPAAGVVRSRALPLPHEPVPSSQVLAGSPTIGVAELCTIAGVEVGVWEMTPGMSTDTEIDEVFVVVSGRARIQFTSIAAPPIDVGVGDVVRLPAGAQTVWTVFDTLRKVYLALPASTI